MNQEQLGATASMSLRAYAKHRKALGLRGGSHVAVRQAIRDQRIVEGVTADGQIIAEIADTEWGRNTAPRPLGPARGRPQERPRPRARSRIAHSASSGQAAPSTSLRTGSAAVPTRQVAPQVASPPPLSFGGSNYQLDRARRENVRLRKELIELRKLEEKFVNADEVKVAQFNRDRMIRDRLLNIRDRLAAPMSAESDIKKCWDMLDIEIRQVLTALADAGVDSVSSEVEPETAMV